MRLKRVAVTCIAIITVFCSALASEEVIGCGPNEKQVHCVNICNNCGHKGPCPTSECYAGCDCVPGFLRNSAGACVPKYQCNALVTHPPQGKEVALSGGCPNGDFCVVSCQLRGFKDGICLGPKKGLCNCFSQVPPEPIPPPSPGALEDSPPVYETKTACPNVAKCTAFCKKRGTRFIKGNCVGRDRQTCRCVPCNPRTKGCPIVDPPGPLAVKRNPADLLSGGCPIFKACFQSCRLHGFQSGQCIGRQKDLCRCLNCQPGVGACPGLPDEYLEYY